jgi:hypothetical protein
MTAAARRVLHAALATDLVAFLERAFREIEPDKTLLLVRRADAGRGRR